MTIFDCTRTYSSSHDVRENSEWKQRLLDSTPNGALWTLIGPRRSGKTWMLESLKAQLKGLAIYRDLRHLPTGGIKEVAGSVLLLDEPGVMLQKKQDAKEFLQQCIKRRDEGARILLALTPGEWVRLSSIDPGGTHVQTKDQRTLLPLTAEQAKRLARVDWAQTLLEQLPVTWTRNPFVLELAFELAEAHPFLRTDLERLSEALIDRSQKSPYLYLDSVFREGLSESQRQVLRQVAWHQAIEAQSDLQLLEACGLIESGPAGRYLADPVLAHHLPPPFVIHHVSDVHCGKKSATAIDQKVPVLEREDGHPAARKLVRDTYVAFVKELAEHHRAPHLLVASGDLAETGAEAELKEASDWMLSIREYLGPHPDLPAAADRVLIVGGNHDVDWGRTRGKEGDRQRHETFARVFKGWKRPLLEQPPTERPLTTVAYPGFGVEFVLLGSAGFGGEEVRSESEKELIALLDQIVGRARDAFEKNELDRYQELRQLLERIDPGLVHHEDVERITRHRFGQPVRIAVLHHPVSPLPAAPEVAQFAGLMNAGALKDALFKAGVCLVLHGHQHSGWFAEERWPGRYQDHVLHIASAPTLGSRELQEYLGFNEIRICREGTTSYHLEVVRYIREGTQWVPSKGRMSFDVEDRPGS